MTAMQMVSDKPQMEHELMQFTVSLDRIRHWTRRLHYTSGVEHPATRTGSYWLIDPIASVRRSPHVTGHDFQVWKEVGRQR